MINEDCLFCMYPSKHEELVLYKNDDFYIIPNAYPKTPRHLLVVPYNHINSFNDIQASMIREWQQAVRMGLEFIKKDFKKLYQKIIDVDFDKKSKNCCQKMIDENKKPSDHYNIIVNHGKFSGQTIDHFHSHIIPRYENDYFFKNNKL